LTDLSDSFFDTVYLQSIVAKNNKYWIGANEALYVSTNNYDVKNFSKDTTTDTWAFSNTDGGDLIYWKNDTSDELYGCSGSNVYKLDATGDDWDVFSTVNGLQLEVFDSLSRLAVMGDNNVWLLDSNGNTTLTLELPDWVTLTGMAYSNQRLFISTFNANNANAQVIEWDGLSPEASVFHTIPNAKEITNIGAYKDGAVAVSNTGEIFYVAGGVQTIGYLPIYYIQDWYSEDHTRTTMYIPPHGIKTVGDEVLISVGSTFRASNHTKTFIEEFPSGVYAYNPNVGVYLKYTISEDGYFGGIENRPSIIFTQSDFNSVSQDVADKLLVGGVIQPHDSAVIGTASLSAPQTDTENRGYWVSPKIESQLIDDQFDVLLKWTKLTNDSDKIIVKYRQTDNTLRNWEESDTPKITWVNTTSFTTTEDISDVSVGDEVQFTAGAGAGYLAHITDISESGGTYTVTIDETVTGVTVGDRARIIFNNWIKWQTIDKDSEDNAQGYRKMRIDSASKWIQVKIELRGIETRIEDIIINNKNHKKSI
jgi:hypothetical protein